MCLFGARFLRDFCSQAQQTILEFRLDLVRIDLFRQVNRTEHFAGSELADVDCALSLTVRMIHIGLQDNIFRSDLDFETNLRSEIWSVHIGEALGIDVEHVEEVVRHAIAGARAELDRQP